MPTGVNVYLFARHYGIDDAEITTAIVVSTAASVVTISAVLALQ